MHFPEKLLTLRKANNLTQEQLAEAVDVVPSSISRIETNANSCSLSLLINIATALNVGIDALVCDSFPSVINLQKTTLLHFCALSFPHTFFLKRIPY